MAQRLLVTGGREEIPSAKAHYDSTDVPRKMNIEPLDKRSMDYVLRSGLAGGLAGCAVCSFTFNSLAMCNAIGRRARY